MEVCVGGGLLSESTALIHLHRRLRQLVLPLRHPAGDRATREAVTAAKVALSVPTPPSA